MNVTLVTGLEAQAWIDNEANTSEWQNLFMAMGNRQSYLAPAFCRVWYQQYAHQYELIIVTGTNAVGSLCAVMPLARHNESITGAGAAQAEYQGWLALPDTSDDFFTAAVEMLGKRYPQSNIRLKYVLPGASAKTLESFSDLNANAKLVRHLRPIVTTDLDSVRSSLKKKSNRSKLNRLKRCGDLQLKHVANQSDFDRYMDQVFAAYDLRQGAKNDSCPFFEDSAKRAFHQAWFEHCPDDVYISILTLDDRPVASFFGVVIGQTLANAIVSYEPDVSMHSASKLHIYLLAEELAAKGFDAIDLTPGGDPWKQRFAAENEEVLEFVYWPDRNALKRLERRDAILGFAKKMAAAVGMSPTKVRALSSSLGQFSPKAIGKRLKKLLWMRTENRIYRLQTAQFLSRDGADGAHLNSAADLVAFEPVTAEGTRQQFLSSAFDRLTNGHSVYTVRDGDHLTHSGWVARNQRSTFLTDVDYNYEYPAPGAVIFDFLTHSRSPDRAYFEKAVLQIMSDLTALAEPPEWVYIAASPDDIPSLTVIEKCGFHYHESVVKRTRFSRTSWDIGPL